MSDKIALIYEGVSAEKRLFDSIEKNFLSSEEEMVFIRLPADGNIYMLWERMKQDEFDTDIISIVKEMCKTVENPDIKSLVPSEFSSVYLFFDYDIHSKNENLKAEHRKEDILLEMLKTFNNETENGKLYISYPMIESIKDICCEKCEYKSFYISYEDSGKYKSIAWIDSEFNHYESISREMWLRACKASIHQASIIVRGTHTFDYKSFLNTVTQETIYSCQRDVFLKDNDKILILNALPLFLVEFYDVPFWNEVVSVNQ